MRIKWQKFSNPDCASLHIDRSLPNFSTDACSILAKDVNEEGQRLLEMFSGIHGIVQASSSHLNKFEIHIVKGVVFEWDEIVPRVESVVLQFFSETISNPSA